MARFPVPLREHTVMVEREAPGGRAANGLKGTLKHLGFRQGSAAALWPGEKKGRRSDFRRNSARWWRGHPNDNQRRSPPDHLPLLTEKNEGPRVDDLTEARGVRASMPLGSTACRAAGVIEWRRGNGSDFSRGRNWSP